MTLPVVYLTDNDLRPTSDPLVWSKVDAVVRYLEPGVALVTCPATPDVVGPLAAAWAGGGRGVIEYDGQVLLSGPIERPYGPYRWSADSEQEAGPGTVTFAFTDDLAPIAARVTYPDPAATWSTQDTAPQYIDAGQASTVLLNLVNANAGPGALLARRVAHLVMGADPYRGPQVRVASRFASLLEEARGLVTLAGHEVAFRTVVDPVARTITFEVYGPEDRSQFVVFSRALGNLRQVSLDTETPRATVALVAGQGEGVARVTMERDSRALLDTWERTVSGSWGGAWTAAHSGLSVADGRGWMSLSPGSGLTNEHSGELQDLDLYIEVYPTAGEGTGAAEYSISVRVTEGGDNLVNLRSFGTVGGAPTVSVAEQLGGVEIQSSSTVDVPDVGAGEPYRLRVYVAGDTAKIKAWPIGAPQPSSWLASITGIDEANQGPGAFRVTTYIPGGWTNSPPIVTGYDNMLVTDLGAAPGLRLETFLDRRDAAALETLALAGDTELAAKAATVELATVTVDTADQRYGVHYGLGDLVTIEPVPGLQTVDRVRAVRLVSTPQDGSVLTCVIGSQAKTTEWLRQSQDLARRLATLEAI